jgi:hypothetical protein
MNKSLLVLIILAFLASCGASKETPRTLEVSFGAISATQPTMLYGQRLDGPEKFARKLEGTSITLPLPNGNWKFQAIYWEAASKYTEGDPKCAQQEVTLSDSVTSIGLTMAKANCNEQEWMGAYQWFSSTFDGLLLEICPAGTSIPIMAAYSPCNDFSHGVTAMKIIFPEYTGSNSTLVNSLESACYPISYDNIFNIPPKIPFGINSDYPMHSIAKIYYANPGCTGAGCCSGFSQDYHFPNGFGNELINGNASSPTSSTYRKLKIEQRSSKRVAISTTSPAAYASATCESLSVLLKDQNGAALVTPINLSASLTCTNCALYTNVSCTIAASSSITIPASSTGFTSLYMKPTGAKPKISATITTNNEWIPGLIAVPTTVTYANIDEAYLESVTSLSEIAIAGVSSTQLQGWGNVFVYQTLDGFRGKMEAQGYNVGPSVAPDVFNFNYTTYLAVSSVSGSSKWVEDCVEGSNCYLDMNIASSSGLSIPAGADLQFVSDGLGAFRLMPQGTAEFYKMP